MNEWTNKNKQSLKYLEVSHSWVQFCSIFSTSSYTPSAFLPQGLCTCSFYLDIFLPGFSRGSNLRQRFLWSSKLRKFPASVPITSLCFMLYSQNTSLSDVIWLCVCSLFFLCLLLQKVRSLRAKNSSALLSLTLQRLEQDPAHQSVLHKSLWNEFCCSHTPL